jgi:hypothetical protein
MQGGRLFIIAVMAGVAGLAVQIFLLDARPCEQREGFSGCAGAFQLRQIGEEPWNLFRQIISCVFICLQLANQNSNRYPCGVDR